MSGRALHRLSSNQLISLLDWAAMGQLGPSAASAGLQVRAASSSTLAKSLKYARDRKAHDSGLSELRKAWAKEHEEAEARRAAAALVAEERRKAALSRRAQTDAADKEVRRAELVARQQAEREQRVSRFVIFPRCRTVPAHSHSHSFPHPCRLCSRRSGCGARSCGWISWTRRGRRGGRPSSGTPPTGSHPKP
jgi:hypothetical protein